MTLVVGLGCQRGCDAHTLLGLFDAALAEGGIERQRITALASIARKQDEPGLLALAAPEPAAALFQRRTTGAFRRPPEPQIRDRLCPYRLLRHRRKRRPGTCRTPC